MAKLPAHLPRPTSLLAHRPSLLPSRSTTSPSPYNASTPTTISLQQSRAATFIPRPRRPYQFTQMIQLSDGSTYTVRSTSPTPLVRSVKDSRNHALWQPSDKSLQNVELDEAGKLAAFRGRFGRGFDLSTEPAEDNNNADKTAEVKAAEENPYDLGDLISDYAATAAPLQKVKHWQTSPKKSQSKK